jgi:hypothetical protein
MSKKDKKKIQQRVSAQNDNPTEPILSRRGWKIVAAGVVVVILGFIVLSFTDPRGQNVASNLSPILIIGGYALIGAGIVTKVPSSSSSNR